MDKSSRMAVFGAVLIMCLNLVTGTFLPDKSFDRQFDEIDANGVRQVGSGYDMGGSTVVHKKFTRLTPDRQNKRGWIWSQDKFEKNKMSMIITFRVSGQAARWYGDGIGLWITEANNYMEGNNHGFVEKYNGVGVVFDTFVNSDHKGGHKDVSVYVNDGNRDSDYFNDNPKMGCNVPSIRYHEKNDAFKPSVNASRAKIVIDNSQFTVEMDPYNVGDWIPCYSQDLASVLRPGFLGRSTIGLTASTGSLADNHDILSLLIWDDLDHEEHHGHDEFTRDKLETAMNGFNLFEMEKAGASKEDLIHEMQNQLEDMSENFDHKLAQLKESSENTIGKLREQEAQDEQRIRELERIVNAKLDAKVKDSMGDIHEKIDKTIKKSAEKAGAGGGWKLPFFFIIVLLAGIGGFGYKKYQELRKSHLL